MTVKKESVHCYNCIWRERFSERGTYCHPAASDSRNIKAVEFSEGDALLEENKKLDGFFCIKKGLVKVMANTSEFNNLFLWHSKPGDVLGIESYVMQENPGYSAYASGKVKACFVSPVTDGPPEGGHPKVLFKLIRTIYRLTSSLEK